VNRLRVVLDTNVLVSGVAYPSSLLGRILQAWRSGSLEVTLSRFILDEMARVLPRMPTARFAPREARDLTDTLALLARIVEPTDIQEPALRDRCDLPVLGTLLASEAQYLITGDKDLLALADRYPIVTPAQFWARHGF